MVAFTLLTSFLLSMLLVPLVRRVSFQTGRVSQPRSDRWHRLPTATLGGVGMFAAFLVTVLAYTSWSGRWGELRLSLLLGSGLMFLLGLVDDYKRLSPPAKLLGQIIAAALVIFYGRVIDFFPWGFANVLLTFFWLVGITNAINLLDNMDGLASGISLIAAGFLSFFFYQAGSEPLLLFSLALSGSILGFLVFNFPPAKIFMGDSGSLFLGFTLAALAVALRPRASDVFTVIGVPVMLFLLPILDTGLVTITRIMRGQSPAQGGTDHTSHRLIAFGLSERQAVLALYGIAILSGTAGTVLEALNYELSLVLIPLLLIGLSLLTAYLGRLKVVSTYTRTPSNFSRLIIDLTYKRRIFEMLLDFFLISVSYYVALWTRYGFNMNDSNMDRFLQSLPVALAASYVSFFWFGIYRGLWRYVGIEDLSRFARASLGAVILTAAVLLLIFASGTFSPVVFFLFGVFLFLSMAAARISFRILDRIYGRQLFRSEKTNVLLFGAEDAGEIALRWILSNPQLGYVPVGFIDDDPYKWGRIIHGVRVLGGREQVQNLLENNSVEGLIITSPAFFSSRDGDTWLAELRKRGLWVRALRLDFEMVE